MSDIKEKMETARKIKEELEQNTMIPCAHITLSTQPCGIWDSKVGGLPYFPEGAQVPTNVAGKPLYLLAQINCGQIGELPDFPQKGMLQFFISDNDLYGCPLSVPSPQENWRVVYYPEIDKTTDPARAAELFGDGSDRELSPFSGEYKMTFARADEGISINDYRFEEMFVEGWNELNPGDEIDDIMDLDDEVYEFLWDGAGSDEEEDEEEGKKGCEHKIGGYPFFTQSDPREDEENDYDTLLFQLDTDGANGVDVMWGDLGIGNFFINREALKNLDFSDVLYNWDCY